MEVWMGPSTKGWQDGLRSQVRALFGNREAILEPGSEAELGQRHQPFSQLPSHILLGLKVSGMLQQLLLSRLLAAFSPSWEPSFPLLLKVDCRPVLVLVGREGQYPNSWSRRETCK